MCKECTGRLYRYQGQTASDREDMLCLVITFIYQICTGCGTGMEPCGCVMPVFTSDMLLMGYSYTLGMRLWCVGDGWGGAGM